MPKPNSRWSDDVLMGLPQEIRDASGGVADVVLEEVDNSNRQIVATSDRVRMVLEVRFAGVNSSGAKDYRWIASTLEIDSQHVPIVEGVDHLGEIFKNPDSWPPKDISGGLPQGLPISLRRAIGAVLRMLPGDVDTEVELRDDNYVMTCKGEGFTFGASFVRKGRTWVSDPQHPIDVTLDDADVTDEVREAVKQALSVLGRRRSQTGAAPKIGTPLRASKSNSVDVRTSSVRRI